VARAKPCVTLCDLVGSVLELNRSVLIPCPSKGRGWNGNAHALSVASDISPQNHNRTPCPGELYGFADFSERRTAM
jgi:hypothetical protein